MKIINRVINLDDYKDYSLLKSFIGHEIYEIHDPKFEPLKASGQTRNVSNDIIKLVPSLLKYRFKQYYEIRYRTYPPIESLLIHELAHVYDRIATTGQRSLKKPFRKLHEQFLNEKVLTYENYKNLQNPGYLYEETELFARLFNLWVIKLGIISPHYLNVSVMDKLCSKFYYENELEIDNYMKKEFPVLKEYINDNKIQKNKHEYYEIIR